MADHRVVSAGHGRGAGAGRRCRWRRGRGDTRSGASAASCAPLGDARLRPRPSPAARSWSTVITLSWRREIRAIARSTACITRHLGRFAAGRGRVAHAPHASHGHGRPRAWRLSCFAGRFGSQGPVSGLRTPARPTGAQIGTEWLRGVTKLEQIGRRQPAHRAILTFNVRISFRRIMSAYREPSHLEHWRPRRARLVQVVGAVVYQPGNAAGDDQLGHADHRAARPRTELAHEPARARVGDPRVHDRLDGAGAERRPSV